MKSWVLVYLLLLPLTCASFGLHAHTLNVAFLEVDAVEDSAYQSVPNNAYNYTYNVGLHYSPVTQHEATLSFGENCLQLGGSKEAWEGKQRHIHMRVFCDGPDAIAGLTLSLTANDPYQWYIRYSSPTQNFTKELIKDNGGAGFSGAILREWISSESDDPRKTEDNNTSVSTFSSFFLGVEHILLGWDHLLLLVGFIVLCRTKHSLLAAITGFTIGHSTTLILVGFNVISISSQFVEAMIAASLLLLGVHAVSGQKQSAVNLLICAVGIGLFHGMGFANTAIQLFSLEQGLLNHLLAFNLGIEFGQLLFIGLVLLMLRSYLDSSWVRAGLSYTVGSLGSFYLLSVLF